MSKMDAPATTGICVGYDIDCGCRWAGICNVWSLDELFNLTWRIHVIFLVCSVMRIELDWLKSQRVGAVFLCNTECYTCRRACAKPRSLVNDNAAPMAL